jgi:hypothetical protein
MISNSSALSTCVTADMIRIAVNDVKRKEVNNDELMKKRMTNLSRKRTQIKGNKIKRLQ